MSKFENLSARSRHFRILLYTDNSLHMQVFQAIKANTIFTDDDSKYEYVGNVHRGLDDEKEHVHIVLSFVNPKKTASVCRAMGFVDDLGTPDDQFVRAIVKAAERPVDQQLLSACVYLTHRNAPEKEQYSTDDLFGTAELLKYTIKHTIKYESKECDMPDSVCAALDWIRDQDGNISAFQLGKWLANSPYWKANNNKFVWAVLREHNLKVYKDAHPVPHEFSTLEEYSAQRAFDLSEFELLYGD